MPWIIAILLCQQDDVEELKKRVAELEEKVKKLTADRPTEPKPPQEEVDKLKKKVKRLEEDLEKLQESEQKRIEKGETQDKPAILGALNPTLTCFINQASRIDSKGVNASDGSKIDDRIFLRGGELDLRAAVDPYVDAVLILPFRQEPNGEFAAELEEAYGVIKRIPILESAPLGMRLKVGKYLAPIGQVNQIHQHDLPWTTYPLAVTEYLGSESGSTFFDSGFAMTGGGILLRPPFFEGSSALDFELHACRAGETAVTEDSDNHNPGFLSRLGFYTKFADVHSLSAALAGYGEDGRNPGYLLNLDVTYAWRPIGVFRSLILGGSLFYAHRQEIPEGGAEEDADRKEPIGWYLYAQYQIDWHWYAGIRWDEIQSLADDNVKTDVFAAYLSYYTSEYFRIRLGYEYRSSDKEEEHGNHTGLLELNLVFGSHPPEPWWVNR